MQRILVQESFYDRFRDAFVAATKELVAGDPKDEKTFIGPMIDEKEAKRLDGWIQEAVKAGAKVLCGGKRSGAMLEATVLENVDPKQKVSCMEAFGPVALLQKYTRFRRRAPHRQRFRIRPAGRRVHVRRAQGHARLGRA